MRARVLLTTGCVLAALLSPTAAVATGNAAGQPAVSKEKAQKLAKAGVLTKKDMTGFTAEKNTADPTDAEDEAWYYACLGGKGVPTYVARNHGFSYSKGAQTLDSSADVVKSAKIGKADFKLVAGKKAPGCMKKAFARGLEREGGAIESVKIKKIAVDVEGADLAIGYRYDILASIQGVLIRLVGHDLYVLVGPTEITLSPGRFDGKMPGLAKSEALAEKLVARVKAV